MMIPHLRWTTLTRVGMTATLPVLLLGCSSDESEDKGARTGSSAQEDASMPPASGDAGSPQVDAASDARPDSRHVDSGGDGSGDSDATVPWDAGGPLPKPRSGSPYINVSALAYGRTPSYSPSECTEIGKRFGVVLGTPGGTCSSASAKAANPNVVLLSYINTSNMTLDDGLYQYAQAHGGVDLFALNAVTSALQQIDGKNINLSPGDRVSSYAHRSSNGQTDRWQTDYTSAAARQRLLDYVVYQSAQTKAAGWDGLFIDNEDRGCGYSGHLVSGTVEGGFTGPADLDQGAQMEANCNALKLLLDQQIPSNVYLVHNTGNYGTRTLKSAPWFWQIGTTQVNGTPLSRELAEAFVDARGALQEFRYSFTNVFGDIDSNYADLYEIWTKKGSPANHLYIMWWLRRGAGSVAANSDRVQLFALGTHLLYQWQASFIRYDATDYNNTPLTGDWFDAMGTPLGNASGGKTQIDARTYRRDFQNGVVVVRFRTSDSDDYTSSANYDLGDSYHPVSANGGISATSVTSVTLANSEAFFGVLDPNFQ